MSALFRFLGRLWRGLDGLRKVLHLVLLLALFAIVWAAFHPPSPVLPRRAALVVEPEGRLVEQLSGDPVDRAFAEAGNRTRPETLVRDVTDSIRAAAKDARIAALVLDTSELDGGGLTKLEAIAAALRDFRATGKKVYSHGALVSQEGYYLMAQADQVWLEPGGAVGIDGFASYRHYLHDLLDKLAVTVNVFKVGTYKSAVEQFTQSQMSAADREQTSAYIKPLWAAYESSVVTARKLKDGALTSYVDDAPQNLRAVKGDAALMAERAGLIDARKTHVEFESQLVALVGEDPDSHSFNSVDYQQYAAVALRGERGESGPSDVRVAVLPAIGEIKDGDQPPGTVGGDSFARLLREARFDKSVKAVVLRIDSPGGSVLASEEIRQEVDALKAAGKPVVASFGSVAASGGYYIAMDSDQIYAEPTTITGSIGVFAVLPTFERTLAKIGVGTDGVATSKFAGLTDLTHELSPEAKDVLQQSVEFTYWQFVGHVAAARKQTPEQIDAIAQGRVWIATDARSRGLVDEIGGLEAAIKGAAKLAKLSEGSYGISYREKRLTWREALVRSIGSTASSTLIKLGLYQATYPELARALSGVERELHTIASFNDPRGIYLYCACDQR